MTTPFVMPEIVAEEIALLPEQLSTLLDHDNPLIKASIERTFQSPGKQLRPILVLLAAGVSGGITPKAQRGALLMMLLHQASLIHDDVIDEANSRRDHTTIHTTWGNKVAILLGDYLLTKALGVATAHQDYELVTEIVTTAQLMSEGELIALEQAQQHQLEEATYLEVIHKKTAHLLGTCLAIGAKAANGTTEHINTLRQAGEAMGMAFQLKDDWLDYSTQPQGKPLGLDLQAGYLTLPLIHALQAAPSDKREEIIAMLKQDEKGFSMLEHVTEFVRKSPGMDYTLQQAQHYQQQALDLLNALPTSPYQHELVRLTKAML